jgi:hypothetical protein
MLVLRLSFMLVTLVASAAAQHKAPCFLTSTQVYCVFSDGVIRQSQLCEKSDGSEYCALKEGRGALVHDFSACTGQSEHDTTTTEYRRCVTSHAKFFASLPSSYT